MINVAAESGEEESAESGQMILNKSYIETQCFEQTWLQRQLSAMP